MGWGLKKIISEFTREMGFVGLVNPNIPFWWQSKLGTC